MVSRRELTMFTMSATPFDANGAVDADGLRQHLRRQVDAGCGVYLGSGGAGEGHALSVAELRTVYDIGVSECRGQVPVFANPPEGRTAAAVLAVAQEAEAAGVDAVQLYPMDAGHGMVPTVAEQRAYYEELIAGLRGPVLLSVHPVVGYVTPIDLIVELVARYDAISGLNVIVMPGRYLVELQAALTRRVPIYVGLQESLGAMLMGASGALIAESNLVPRLSQSVVGHLQRGDADQAGEALWHLVRLAGIVARWAPSTARWVKMGMKVLDLPGGNGALRPPYRLPDADELCAMASAFDAMGLHELEGLPEPGRVEAPVGATR